VKIILKSCIVLLILTTIILSFAGCGDKQSEELKDITLTEVTRSVFYAPQYAALSLGFFEEEGLNVELVTSAGADKVTAAVLSGESDIGFCGPESTVYVYNEGRENYLITFAQLTKRDGSFLVARNPDENFTFEKLEGKYIIGGRAGGMPEMSLEWVLRQNGLEPNKDVTVDTSIQFSAMAGAFLQGTGDYVTLFEPSALALEKEGKGYVVASIGEESGVVPYTCYNATKEYIEQNPDVIQAFANALNKGMKWVEENNNEEIAEAIHPYFSDMSIEDLTSVVDRYKSQDSWNESPMFTEESFDHLLDIIISAGILNEEDKVDYEVLFDPSFSTNLQ
jgi:NitT/TauT family transport system substrate-binding protein